MGWRIEQAEEFRQQVEQFTDAERAILAEVYRALLRHGHSPTQAHRLRSTGCATRAPATPTSWYCRGSCSATRSSAR